MSLESESESRRESTQHSAGARKVLGVGGLGRGKYCTEKIIKKREKERVDSSRAPRWARLREPRRAGRRARNAAQLSSCASLPVWPSGHFCTVASRRASLAASLPFEPPPSPSPALSLCALPTPMRADVVDYCPVLYNSCVHPSVRSCSQGRRASHVR